MSSKKPKALDSLRARVRRLQFIVGLGFAALVIGTFITASLRVRLEHRLEALPWFLVEPVEVVLRDLWVLAVLPVLCYGAARILEIKPLSTALGATAAGAAFLGAVLVAWAGLAGLWGGWSSALLNAAAFAGGVMLSHRAVVRARAAAAQGAAKAQVQAEARKAEYMEFLQEAERGAEKTAQREAERVAVVASTGGAAMAVAPEGGAPDVVAAQTSAPAAEGSASPASPSISPAEAGPTSPDAPAEPKAPTPEG